MDVKQVLKPLPDPLAQGYKSWHNDNYSKNENLHTNLATHGQNPPAMVISCCDSRLQISGMFSANAGEIFTHRNIANFIPPYVDDDGVHGTSAAIEYGVCALKIAHLIVIGHAQCGGAEGAFDACHNDKKPDTKFLAPWLELLRPGYDAIKDKGGDRPQALREMERQCVIVSLQNLLSFPFVKEAIDQGVLTLHGLWHDMGPGLLYQYSPQSDQFEPV